jgi:cytochrome P450
MIAPQPPGPRLPFGLGPMPGFLTQRQTRIQAYAADMARYGDMVKYQLGPILVLITRSPDHFKHVLQEHHTKYRKGRGLRKMRLFLGDGLLTSEGDHWRRQRRLMQPAFHRQRLAVLADTMTATCAAMLDRWGPLAARGEVVDVGKELMRLTLAIAAKALFSVDVSHAADTVGDALTTALHEANRRLFTLVDLPLFIPTPHNIALRGARETLDRVVYDIIATRRRNGAESKDLLGMLIESKDEETGETMSDEQLRDETMTLFLAGHETTANALAWTAFLLSKAPSEQRRLEEEVDRVLGGRAPRFADLADLAYTRRVVDEAMRLYPPAWMFGREALVDDVVGGYAVPKGALVAMSPFLVHRHPEHWPNPEGFDPDRFLPEPSAARHKYAYMPFGGGPRVCIGNQFALVESVLCLAMIVSRFRLELAPGARVEPEPVVTLRPKGGMPMRIRARATA